MAKGKTLDELKAEIARRAAAKKDYLIKDTSRLEVFAWPDGEIGLRVGDLTTRINDLAHRQIGDALAIPAKYYDRCKQEAPELLANNINAWFKKHPTKQLVRTLDGTARAFLSDKYRPLENEDLAAAVLPVLTDLDLDILSSEITDRRLYLKCVDKRVTRELAKTGAEFGDGGHTIVRVAAPAITISNSEVGQGALSVLVGYYDSWCSNLATFGERSSRKYHVGQRHDIGDEVYALLSDQSRRLNDAAVWSAITDVTKAAFDRVHFDSLIDKVEGTKADKIEDAVQVISLASKRYSLNEGEGKGILKHLIAGADLSRFGLLNAITRQAQDVADYDRATELERLGGEIVELPRDEWKVLAEAA
jgi:hypothetical protein